MVISGHCRIVFPPLLLASSLSVPPPDSKIVEYCRTSPKFSVNVYFSGAKPLTLGFCCWLAVSLVSIGLQKILGIF